MLIHSGGATVKCERLAICNHIFYYDNFFFFFSSPPPPLAPILIFILQHNSTPSTFSTSGVNISWYLSLLFRSKGGSHRAGNLHWTGVFSTPTGHKIQIKLL